MGQFGIQADRFGLRSQLEPGRIGGIIGTECSGSDGVIDEIAIYRIVGVTFLIGLPAALIYIILAARNVIRQLIRWIAIAFIGIGTCFVGLVPSWPGPHSIRGVMMLGGVRLRQRSRLGNSRKTHPVSNLLSVLTTAGVQELGVPNRDSGFFG